MAIPESACWSWLHRNNTCIYKTGNEWSALVLGGEKLACVLGGVLWVGWASGCWS